MRRIRGRVMFLVAAGIVVPLAALVVLGGAAARGLAERVLEERLLMAEGLAAQLDHDVREALATLDAAARVSPGGEAGGAAPGPERVRRGGLLREILPLGPDAEGEAAVLAATPAAEMALRSGRPQFVTVVREDGGRPRVFALVVAKDGAGRSVGVVAGLLDTGGPAWWGRLRGYLPPDRPRKAAWVVDAEGEVLVGTPVAGLLDSTRLIARLATRTSGIERVEAGDGEREAIAVAPLGSAPWAVISCEPERDLLGPWAHLRVQALLLGVLALGVGLLLAWGAGRSVTVPIGKLRLAAEKIEEGKLAEPVPDLGRDELGELGRAFERMRRALAESAERKALLRKIISAQEDERRRIARELHDETCQTLVALRMAVDAAHDGARMEGTKEKLKKARELAARTLDEVHQLMFDLRPSALDDLGLLAAIRSYATRTLEPLGVAVQTELEPPPVPLPAEMETALFRACQEAVNNVARHAEAEDVLVQMSWSDGAVEIEVEDDGKGFDPAEIGGPSPSGRGLGILGMRERIEIFGGTATVDSAPGKGTRVVLRVPAPKEAAAHV